MTSSIAVVDVDDNAVASTSSEPNSNSNTTDFDSSSSTTTTTTSSFSNSNNSSIILFDSFGILEHILCYVDTPSDLLSCCLVNKRWKEAGRNDKLWEAAIPRLWQSKIFGFGINNNNNRTTTGGSLVFPSTTNTNTTTTASSSISNNNYYPSLIYWRSLYTKDALKRMSIEQIKSIFNHPLLSEKKKELLLMKSSNTDNNNTTTTTTTKTMKKADIQRFFQVHMLDIMSDIATTATTTTTSTITGGGRIAGRSPTTAATTTRTASVLDLDEGQSSSSSSSSASSEDNTCCYGNNYHFFNDIYYGSYVCSILDSKRTIITTTELCAEFGFDMYFKIAEEEVDDADRTFLARYDMDHGNTTTESETTTSTTTTTGTTGILLYHHSTCYFKESNRDFEIVLKENNNIAAHTYHPTDLKWRWIDVGKRIQVGPYPSLLVCRIKHNWGWKLENQHVVLLFRDR